MYNQQIGILESFQGDQKIWEQNCPIFQKVVKQFPN